MFDSILPSRSNRETPLKSESLVTLRTCSRAFRRCAQASNSFPQPRISCLSERRYYIQKRGQMISACFNPACRRELMYLRDGRVVRIIRQESCDRTPDRLAWSPNTARNPMDRRADSILVGLDCRPRRRTVNSDLSTIRPECFNADLGIQAGPETREITGRFGDRTFCFCHRNCVTELGAASRFFAASISNLARRT
jgi:hypothetical protein